MTVYKNGERLGVMVESGLSGEYCWAVSMSSGTVLIGPQEGGRPIDADSDAIFRRFDLDRDGILSRNEMKAAVHFLCPTCPWEEELWDDFCIEWEADPASGFEPVAFGRLHRFAQVATSGANAVPEIHVNPFEPPELEPDWYYASEIGGGPELEIWMLNQNIKREAELKASGLL